MSDTDSPHAPDPADFATNMMAVQVCLQQIISTAHERGPASPKGLARLLSAVALLQEVHAEGVLDELARMIATPVSFREGFKPGSDAPVRCTIGLLRVTDTNNPQVRAIVVTNHKFTTESLLTLIGQTPDDLPVTRHAFES